LEQKEIQETKKNGGGFRGGGKTDKKQADGRPVESEKGAWEGGMSEEQMEKDPQVARPPKRVKRSRREGKVGSHALPKTGGTWGTIKKGGKAKAKKTLKRGVSSQKV